MHLGIPDKDKNRDGYLYFVLVRHRDYFGNSDTSRIKYRSDEIVYIATHSTPFETTATLYFTQFALADSYDVYGVLRLAREEGKGIRQVHPIVMVDEGDSVIDAIGPGGGRLTIYAGNNQVGNPRDTFGIPYAYPIALRLIDTLGQGIDGDTFIFRCPGAYFGGAWQPDSCRAISLTRIYLDTALSGMVIPSPLILPINTGPYEVNVQWLKGGQVVSEKELKFRVINDPEQSGLSPPHSHETTDSINRNIEIPGDGYNDGAGQKTVKIEIDYDGGIYPYTSVAEASVYCESILTTARILPDIIIDQDVGAIPDEIQASQIRKYLKDYRTYSDRIHIIIAGKCSSNPRWYGIAVGYFQAEDNIPGYVSHHVICANYATGDSASSQAHLDSCGIYIFATTIKQDVDYYFPLWNYRIAIGTVMAHEIGHALGISVHADEYSPPYNGVMRAIRIDQDHDPEDYRFFDTLYLNKKTPYNAMNTRDVLGIHTVDIKF